MKRLIVLMLMLFVGFVGLAFAADPKVNPKPDKVNKAEDKVEEVNLVGVTVVTLEIAVKSPRQSTFVDLRFQVKHNGKWFTTNRLSVAGGASKIEWPIDIGAKYEKGRFIIRTPKAVKSVKVRKTLNVS